MLECVWLPYKNVEKKIHKDFSTSLGIVKPFTKVHDEQKDMGNVLQTSSSWW